MEAFEWGGLLLSAFGAAVVLFGGLAAIAAVVRGAARPDRMIPVRAAFASRIILGLDFLVASDIVATVSAPGMDEVMSLGGVVLIRAVLTWLLSKETKELEERPGRHAPKA